MMGNLLSISKNCNLHTWRNWAAWSKSCQVSKVQTSEAGSSSSIRTEELVEVCCSSRRLAAASFSCSGKASFGSHSHPSGGPILPSFLGAIHQKLKIGHGSCFRELWKIAFLLRWSLSQHPGNQLADSVWQRFFCGWAAQLSWFWRLQVVSTLLGWSLPRGQHLAFSLS